MTKAKSYLNKTTEFLIIFMIGNFIMIPIMLYAHSIGVQKVRKEAVERGFATWEENEQGPRSFVWNNNEHSHSHP